MQDKLRQFHIGDLADALILPNRLSASGWFEHIPFAMYITAKAQPRRFVELGTYHGVSYCAFCEAALATGLDAQFFAIDTWKGDPHAGYYGEDVFQQLSHYHDQRYSAFSTLIKKTFEESLSYFADASIDMLHIDGYHSYEDTKANFGSWLPKMSDQGIVMFHDTAVHRDDFGVWQLWEELRGQYPSFEFKHGHGLGVLFVGDRYPGNTEALFSATHDEVSALRKLFSYLGKRWRIEHEKQQATERLTQNNIVLKQREDQIQHQQETLAQQTAEIQQQQSTLAQGEDQIHQQQETLAQYDAQIQQFKITLTDREDQIQQQQETLAQHDEQIQQFKITLAEQNAQIQQQLETLAQRDTHIQQQQDTLDQRDRLIQQEQAILAQHDTLIQQQQDSLVQRDAKIQQQHETLVQRDSQIQQQRETLTQNDILIQGLQETLASHEAQIQQQQDALAKRDTRIQYLQDALTQREASIQRQLDTLAQRDERIHKLQESLDQYANTNRDIKDELSKHKDSIKKQKVQLSNSNQRIERLENEIAEYAAPAPSFENGWTRFWRKNRFVKLIWWTISFQLHRRLRKSFRYRHNADLIAQSDLFDADWYLEQNPDVAEAGMNPIIHYLRYGTTEGRDPTPLFDTDWYLEQNPDVAKADMNPLVHYIRFGASEGRDPRPSGSNKGQSQPNQDISQNASIHDMRYGTTDGDSSKRDIRSFDRQGSVQIPDQEQVSLLHQNQLTCFGKVNALTPVVVYHSHNLKWQGAQNSLFEIASGIAHNGKFQPIVFAPERGSLIESYTKNNIHVFEHNIRIADFSNGSDFEREIDHLAAVYNDAQAQIVHANTLQTFFSVLAAHRAGIASLWNIRESEPPNEYFNYLPDNIREYAFQSLDLADQVVFVANSTRDNWVTHKDTERFPVIPNGIDFERMLRRIYGNNRAQVRASLGLTEGDIVLLSVGTVNERKGQLDLVNAISHLSDDIRKRLVVCMIGFNSGQYSHQVQSKLKNLERTEQIRLIAYEETANEEESRLVAESYLAADMFILCSRYESYPRVILEAMQFALPIISTPCFGVTEQIVDCKNGLFYEQGDFRSLANKITDLASNAELRTSIGEAAYLRLSQLNSYERMVRSYENSYTQILH